MTSTLIAASIAALAAAAAPKDSVYLFSYFRGNGEDGLHLATSEDGYHWTALKGDTAFVAPTVGEQKIMRDPHIARGPDGTFHMLWSAGWAERGVGHASSKDLIHWSEQRYLPVMEHEPNAQNAWAPESFYDAASRRFYVFWSSTIPGRFPETDGTGDGDCNHRIYYTTTRDWKTFAPTKLLFDGGFNVIDASMLRAGRKVYLIVKDETLKPVKKNLRIAVADRPEGPYRDVSEPFTISWVEGPSAIKIGSDYVVYFDHYADPQYYGAMRSRDLKHWEDATKLVSFPQGARHGCVFTAPRSVLEGLQAAR